MYTEGHLFILSRAFPRADPPIDFSILNYINFYTSHEKDVILIGFYCDHVTLTRWYAVQRAVIAYAMIYRQHRNNLVFSIISGI